MIDAFVDGGVMMWVMTVVGVLMVALSARAALRLRGSSDDIAEATAGADAALFWGAFAGLLGVLGTLIGIMQAARAIGQAGEVTATLAWAGIRVTLISTVYGLLILLAGLLFWGALRAAVRRRGPSGATIA